MQNWYYIVSAIDGFERTSLINQLRATLLERGIIVSKGHPSS
jgi:hypothetical protein